MNESTTSSLFSTSSSPCSVDEVAISPGDCVVTGVEEWLEDEALPGFRVWQLAGIILSVLLTIIIALCCCIRFRVPRTKQEIEADYMRNKLTKNFRRKLAKINNTEMDDMDLGKALDRIKEELENETRSLQAESEENLIVTAGFLPRIGCMFNKMHSRYLGKDAPVSIA
ncbi:transmembrane inner ear expressed protein [Prorops nasuta]|uniref:transmembrane inner ear expressed protein n=1 Tax=Prorops nasuta TaxID=863751 RepID=UPI0034CEE505